MTMPYEWKETVTGAICNTRARVLFNKAAEKAMEELERSREARDHEMLSALGNIMEACGNNMIGDDEEDSDERD